jgi:glycosyltransferase involved in cell wall biosynthesis
MKDPVVLLGPLPPPYGGVSVYMSLLVEHLRGAGVRVWAYFGEPYEGDEMVRRFRHRRLGLVPLALGAGRGARVLDASHFHLEYPHPLLLPAWLLCKLARPFRWYKNIHDGSLPARWREFSTPRRALFRAAVRGVDEFVVVSEELRRWLLEEVGVKQPVTVVAGLLPTPARHPEATPSAELEESLRSFLQHPRRVCAVGVFIEDYGFLDAARAVERLRAETGEEIGLLLLDGAFARDEAYRERVLEGRGWVTVLENVPHADVPGVLRRSDALVRAFGRESFGLSRVEALWCGVPVVATTAGETRGMLTYEFGDAEALTRQLRRALYEPGACDVERWAAEYRREAEENLGKLRRVLGLDAGP